MVPSMAHRWAMAKRSADHRWAIDGNAMVHRWPMDGLPWDPNSGTVFLPNPIFLLEWQCWCQDISSHAISTYAIAPADNFNLLYFHIFKFQLPRPKLILT